MGTEDLMGGSGGGGSQTQNTSQTSQTGPSPVIAPKLENLTDNAWGWMGQNMKAPGYFPGGTVADRSPADLSARDTTWQVGNNSLQALSGQFQPTLSYLNAAANGDFLDLTKNPNFQGAIAAGLAPVTENFTKSIIPNYRGQFASAGRPGAGLEADGMQDLYLNFNRATADAATKAANEAYGMERGLQSGAAQALPGVYGQMGNQAQSWLSMLSGVGKDDNAYAQLLKNDANAKHTYDSKSQLDWYNMLSQTLQSMYPGGQTWGSGTSTGAASGGGDGGQTAQLAGGAMAAAGTVAAAFI